MQISVFRFIKKCFFVIYVKLKGPGIIFYWHGAPSLGNNYLFIRHSSFTFFLFTIFLVFNNPSAYMEKYILGTSRSLWMLMNFPTFPYGRGVFMYEKVGKSGIIILRFPSDGRLLNVAKKKYNQTGRQVFCTGRRYWTFGSSFILALN